MKIGNKASIKKTFNQEEVMSFSKSSMDANPIHFDQTYAASTQFKKCIVQGPLVASLIGGILGSEVPGRGTIYMSQSSKFMKPVFINEEITVNVEITHIREDKNIITLRTWVIKEDGSCALDGEAVVLFLDDSV